MPENIDQAFIRRYEAEVHQAYQRQGSLLRNAVRRKSGVIGSSTTFQKTGTIEAAQKTRNGDVPVQDLDHAPVECPLGDWYAPTLVDDLDTIKTNIDERMVRVNASSWALGRKTDALIIAALEAAGGNRTKAARQLGICRRTLHRKLYEFGLPGARVRNSVAAPTMVKG